MSTKVLYSWFLHTCGRCSMYWLLSWHTILFTYVLKFCLNFAYIPVYVCATCVGLWEVQKEICPEARVIRNSAHQNGGGESHSSQQGHQVLLSISLAHNVFLKLFFHLNLSRRPSCSNNNPHLKSFEEIRLQSRWLHFPVYSGQHRLLGISLFSCPPLVPKTCWLELNCRRSLYFYIIRGLD